MKLIIEIPDGKVATELQAAAAATGQTEGALVGKWLEQQMRGEPRRMVRDKLRADVQTALDVMRAAPAQDRVAARAALAEVQAATRTKQAEFTAALKPVVIIKDGGGIKVPAEPAVLVTP